MNEILRVDCVGVSGGVLQNCSSALGQLHILMAGLRFGNPKTGGMSDWRESQRVKVMEPMDEDTNAQRITVLQERLDHLREQLVSLEEEYALVESELAFLEGGEPSGRSCRVSAVEGQVTCKHSCEHHKALMDPAVWRNLPGDLLEMVFARLPALHQIISLGCLSRDWRRTTQEPRFRRLCAIAAVRSPIPKMFALVDESFYCGGDVSIKLFDGNSQRWHVFEMALQPELYYDTMLACDGGLVCFVTRMLDKEAHPLVIVVLNPLTKEYKVLPALPSLNKVQPKMVHLVMDRNTKCYKVIVVGNKQRRTGKFSGKVYNSATGEWSSTNSTSDLVFGHHFQFRRHDDEQLAVDRVVPCVYDCREAELHDLAPDPALESCKSYALVNDHMFVLKFERQMKRWRTFEDGRRYWQSVSGFVISEYQGQKSQPHWVKLRDHECTLMDRPGSFIPLPENCDMILQGYRGALKLTVMRKEDVEVYEVYRTWLYDLDTCEWQELPAAPVDGETSPVIAKHEVMCELHWDAVP